MSCLLIIDVQNDFMDGGSLEVKGSTSILNVINNLRDNYKFDLIALSKDWHPINHISFASSHKNKKPFDQIITNSNKIQILFPDHCLQNSKGSEFHSDLKVLESDVIIVKGLDVEVDSYSAFYDNDEKTQTQLQQILQDHSITTLYICGLATDFCVLYSCLDSIKCGFKTYFIKDASKGLSEQAENDAIEKMKNNNITIINSIDLLNQQQ